MSKRPPRHHELPRYYLKAFAEPDRAGHVWVFDRGRPYEPGLRWGKDNPCSLGISRAGLHPDGYGRFEGALQKQEHQADRALAKARNGFAINLTEKQEITRYIGMTWRRLRVREQQVRPLLKQRFEGMQLRQQALHAAELGQFTLARGLFAAHTSLSSSAAETDLIRETLLIRHEKLEALLLQRDWSLLCSPIGHYFVTTDNPVVFDHASGVSRSHLLFPLSSRVLLLISPTTAKAHVESGQIPEDRVRSFNQLLIQGAARNVFASQSERWIHESLR